MEIRKYKEGDLERVLEIWFESSSMAHDFLGLDQLKEQKNLIRDTYLPMAETWVAEEDGELRGFLYESREVQEETGEVVLNLKKGELPL